MIALEANVFDPLGAIIIHERPSSKLDTATRRVNRTATLDGNSAITDMGYTVADATFDIRCQLTRAEEATVLRLVTIYPEVVCSTVAGCFLGVIEDVRRDTTGETSITFLVQRALAIL